MMCIFCISRLFSLFYYYFYSRVHIVIVLVDRAFYSISWNTCTYILTVRITAKYSLRTHGWLTAPHSNWLLGGRSGFLIGSPLFSVPTPQPPTARQPITDGLKRTGPYSFCNSICFSFSFVSSPLFLPSTLSLSFALSLSLFYLFFFSLFTGCFFLILSSLLLLHSLLCSSFCDFCFDIFHSPRLVLPLSESPPTSRGQSSFLYCLFYPLLIISHLFCIPPQSICPWRTTAHKSRFSERDFWQCLVCSALVDAVRFAALIIIIFFPLFAIVLILMRPLVALVSLLAALCRS